MAGFGRASSHEPNIVAMAPGAAHATKRWPLEHWRSAGGSGGQGWLCRGHVVGGPDDAALGATLSDRGQQRQGGQRGRKSSDSRLPEPCFKRARSLVSGDTGVMHMATGVGTPVVALFGPTVEAFGFFPYASRGREWWSSPLPCRPCSAQGGARCPLGHHRCMIDIEPGMAYDALRSGVWR